MSKAKGGKAKELQTSELLRLATPLTAVLFDEQLVGAPFPPSAQNLFSICLASERVTGRHALLASTRCSQLAKASRMRAAAAAVAVPALARSLYLPALPAGYTCGAWPRLAATTTRAYTFTATRTDTGNSNNNTSLAHPRASQRVFAAVARA